MRNVLGALSLAAIVVACRAHEITYVDRGCGFFFAPRPCRALGIDPNGGRYLRGDTIRLSAYSDSGYHRVSWNLSGDSVRFISGTVLTTELPADTAAVRLIGLGTGASLITATSALAPIYTSCTVTVHDSSEVDGIYIWAPNSLDPIRVGVNSFALAELRVGFKALTAYPTYWFSSDTTVAVVVQEPRQPQDFRDHYHVVGRRTGQVYIGAGFLKVRDSVLVRFVP